MLRLFLRRPSRDCSVAVRRALLTLTFGAAMGLSSGCGSEQTIPEPMPPNELYWNLALNHRAVALSTTAPYDTLTLVATPRNALGESLRGTAMPTYLSRNIERVVVTPDGVLRAIAADSQPLWVVTTLQIDNLKHQDSVVISVTDIAEPPVLASLSAHPLPPNSAKRLLNPSLYDTTISHLPIRAIDQNGVPIPVMVRDSAGMLPVTFSSSDQMIASIDRLTGALDPIRTGRLTFYVTTTAFGVMKTDTLPFQIGLPAGEAVDFGTVGRSPSLVLYSSEVTIPVGGYVDFRSPVETDINFSEADLSAIARGDSWALLPHAGFRQFSHCIRADCAAGNAAIVPPDIRKAVRVFTAPGTYEFRSVRHGLNGRVVVIDER